MLISRAWRGPYSFAAAIRVAPCRRRRGCWRSVVLMPNRPAAYVTAYLAERDVVVTDISRLSDGSYEIWAQGQRVNVGAPATPEQVVLWAHEAADQVVEQLGNRMLPQ